jgi:hypothetical protein
MLRRLRQNWAVFALLAVIIVSSQIQLSDNNKLATSNCNRIQDITREVNKRVPGLKGIKTGVWVFVQETRRARDNKKGTSYDPHFVRIIDTRVNPPLREVQPERRAIPKC